MSEVGSTIPEEFCRKSWILFDCRHFMGGDPIVVRPVGWQTFLHNVGGQTEGIRQRKDFAISLDLPLDSFHLGIVN